MLPGGWYLSDGGVSAWRRINTSNATVDTIRLADFNGDGKADVFATWGGKWHVSWGGTSQWHDLNTSGYGVDKLKIADFNGDASADILIHEGPPS